MSLAERLNEVFSFCGWGEIFTCGKQPLRFCTTPLEDQELFVESNPVINLEHFSFLLNFGNSFPIYTLHQGIINGASFSQV